jgi:hypothetical protein
LSDWMLLIVLSLTVYRLTWLVTRDSFPPVRRVRELIKQKSRQTGRWVIVDDDGDELLGVHPKMDEEHIAELRGFWPGLAELVMCPYCMSVWFTLGTVSVTLIFVDLALPLLWYGAVAALAAAMCAGLDRMNRE